MTRWLIGLGFLALFLFVVVSGPEASGITISGWFVDDNGNTFEGDIDALAEAGITRGCNPPDNDRFCPNDDVDRGQMAAFLRRALQLPNSNTDHFTDDDNSIFEGDIDAIAEAGITRGCNPPDNDRFCPNDDVDRGQMAAFLRRALQLPNSNTDHFTDDDNSIFEGDIDAIAEAGVTRGCNPPTNTLFCPARDVSRGEMAAFLRRALHLPSVILRIPVGDSGAMSCSKDGERCSLMVNLSAGRSYRIQEGIFQVNNPSSSEEDQFNSSSTSFTLTRDGSEVPLDELSKQAGGGVTNRYWRSDVTFSPGTHTLIGRWRWDGELIQTSTVTVTAQG